MPAASRNRALDVLRALSVLLVIGRHVPPPPPTEARWLQALMLPWTRGGWVGVDVFFVISGFLVSGLLFREYAASRRVSALHFLIRRGFKIYPPFYFMIGASLVVAAGRGLFVPLPRVVSEAFFLQSYVPGMWNHTWSLAVEEHFYLMLVALCMLLVRSQRELDNPFRSLPALYVMLAVALLGLRLHLSATEPYSHLTHLFPTHLRMDSLFFGVCLRYLHEFHGPTLRARVLRLRLVIIPASLALLSIPFWSPVETTPFIYTYGFTLIAWGAGGLVLVLWYSGLNESWPVRALAYLGANSYSVYLWHMPVLAWLTPLLLAALGLPPSYTLAFSVYAISCIMMGLATARGIEAPALRLRDNLFPSRSGPRDIPAQR